MKKLLLVVPFLLASCGGDTATTRAVLDLDYASTSLGYRNSGALSAGRLLLWDQSEGTLITLQSGIQLNTLPPTTPVKLEASSVQGVTVSASVNLTQEAQAAIASEVRSNVSFEISDAVRLNSTNIYDGLSDAYRDLSMNGVNAYAAWRVGDATGNSDRYKYVLLVDEIQASSEQLSYENSSTNSFSFTIVDSVSGEIKVEAPSNSTAQCSGQNVTCYINAAVIKAFINEAGNLDYSPAAFNKRLLVDALRSL
ncbi:MAG: hypothetical protein AAF583_08580 [Pseudomonadota bacterium]